VATHHGTAEHLVEPRMSNCVSYKMCYPDYFMENLPLLVNTFPR